MIFILPGARMHSTSHSCVDTSHILLLETPEIRNLCSAQPKSTAKEFAHNYMSTNCSPFGSVALCYIIAIFC